MGSEQKTTVLVVDDSSYNRRALSDFLSEVPEIEVIGKACDGEEGLRMALLYKPDVITLDLEMPRMDGFTFLRLLMAKRPTPVIVISSHSDNENVFKALELGALDFVPKPTKRISPMINEIQGEVVKKVLLAKNLVPESIHPFPPFGSSDAPPPYMEEGEPSDPATPSVHPLATESKILPRKIVALAASTGGPATLTQILMALPPDIDAGIVVVQHMPPRFTTTFAERLNRQCHLTVTEMSGVDLLLRGHVYVNPGDMCAEINLTDEGLCVVTKPPRRTDRYVPSADRLFKSLAAAAGPDSVAVVLTGMGDDGAAGAAEISIAGGMVIAEDKSTAVIPGMPTAAIENGAAKHIVPLDEVATIIQEVIQTRKSI